MASMEGDEEDSDISTYVKSRRFLKLKRFVFQYEDFSKGIPYVMYKSLVRRDNINADTMSKKYLWYHKKRIESINRDIKTYV